jgi:paraquat-inducible protein A
MHASSAILQGPGAGRDAAALDARAASVELAACSECGQLHRIPNDLHQPADCVRCGATVIEAGSSGLDTPLVLALAALPLFAIAMFQPLISIRSQGTENVLLLPSGAFAFGAQGFWILTPWVLAIAIGAPLLRCVGLAYVLVGLILRLDTPGFSVALKLVQRLRKWAMADVFLVGALVAYSRLPNTAGIEIGAGGYALIAAVGMSLAMEAAFDPRGVWRAIGGLNAGSIDWNSDWRACGDCGAVSQASAVTEAESCWRCGSRLSRRKPDSVGRTWALMVAAMLLYVPAMAWPVMVIDRLGRVQDHTILSGIAALIAARTWPIAIIVFVASIVVPVMKIVGLGLLLASIRLRWRAGLYERTLLFRMIERIGRWSNIDVFAVGILTALIQFGNFASVHPGPAIVPFALVVLATMLATHSFDPRLMWDAASVPHVD